MVQAVQRVPQSTPNAQASGSTAAAVPAAAVAAVAAAPATAELLLPQVLHCPICHVVVMQ
jgi:hypothetical protein